MDHLDIIDIESDTIQWLNDELSMGAALECRRVYHAVPADDYKFTWWQFCVSVAPSYPMPDAASDVVHLWDLCWERYGSRTYSPGYHLHDINVGNRPAQSVVEFVYMKPAHQGDEDLNIRMMQTVRSDTRSLEPDSFAAWLRGFESWASGINTIRRSRYR